MATKVCSTCGTEKDVSLFVKAKGVCKECKAAYLREYRKSNSTSLKEKAKQFRAANRDKILERSKKYYLENKEVLNKTSRRYREKNLDRCKASCRDYYQKNKEELLEAHREWYQTNVEEQREKAKIRYYERQEEALNQKKIYYAQNRQDIQARRKEKIASCPLLILQEKIRGAIRGSFKRRSYSKSSRTQQILGISCKEFRDVLIKSFSDRYGYPPDLSLKGAYHIDHIIPISTAKNEEDVVRLNHYTNLQLLLAEDNLEKSDRLDWGSNGVKERV